MSKHLRAIVLGLVLGTFGLFSCSDRSLTASASDDTMGGFGKAVVQLPDLSSSALSKLPVGVDTNALTLLIVASDMDTMKYSWPVTSLRGQKVEIDGIPSGANRYFEGFLTNKAGVLTHSGKVSVRIIAGQNVPVNLKLSGVGGADVCIEIEGYPSACNSDDSLIINSCLSGVTIHAGSVTGNIQLYIYGEKISGQLILTSPKSRDLFLFNNPLQIINTGNMKLYRGVVLNTTTQKSQYLQIMYYNTNNFNVHIVTDSTLTSNTFGKFERVDCSPVDTLNINTCLRGSTPDDSLTGNIQLSVYGEKASGILTFISSTNKYLYRFTNLVWPIDSVGQKVCQTIAFNTATGQKHYLQMLIINSLIKYGSINADSTNKSPVIAKFYSVDCQDTTYRLSINSCLTGYTPTDSLTGYIHFDVYGEKINGGFNLVSSTEKIVYQFNKPLQITDSADQKYCQTMVLSQNGKYHGLKMIINKSSEITYGYLCEDSNVHGNAIAKFVSEKCYNPIRDTVGVTVHFTGSYSYPYSGFFTSIMSVSIYDKKATGSFFFQNFPAIRSSIIKVAGVGELDSSSNGGYMDLTAVNPPLYKIAVKKQSGIYNAIIYDEKGFVIGNMTNGLY